MVLRREVSMTKSIGSLKRRNLLSSDEAKMADIDQQ